MRLRSSTLIKDLKNREKKEIISFYGKVAFLGWNPDKRRWIDEGWFLDYTTKDGREAIINRNPGTTRGADSGRATS